MAAGTLSVTNNSKAVVGVGTTFTAFKAGDFLTLVVGQVPYTVAIASIESATALTLVLPFDGPTATGLAWDGVKRDTMSLATMGVTVQAQKALRLMIVDENNWRAIFGEEEEISVTLPNGQVVQGMSWGYLSKLLKDVDPVELQDIADQTITAKNQAQGFRDEAEGFKNDSNTIKTQTDQIKADTQAIHDATNTIKTQTDQIKTDTQAIKDQTNQIKTDTGVMRDEANTAKTDAQAASTAAQGFRDQAEEWAKSVNADNLLTKSGNLAGLTDKPQAWLNVRPDGATPLAGDPVGDYDATTKRWVENFINTGTVGPTMNGVMNYGVGDFHLRDSRAYIQPYEVVSDGQLLNRADWPELWAYAQMTSPIEDADWLADPANRGKYSTGDGETTFRVPDRNGVQTGSISGLYARGDGGNSANDGTVQQNAAPNITGTVGAAIWAAYGSATGVFKIGGPVASPPMLSTTTTPAPCVRFEAGLDNAAYGRDNTTEVRTNSFIGVWVIRASGGFVAANTSWTVYNSDQTLPPANTTANGGVIRSEYQVGGSLRAAASFMAQHTTRTNGSPTVSLQIGVSDGSKSAAWQYNTDGHITSSTGRFSFDGVLNPGGNVEISAGEFCSFIMEDKNSADADGVGKWWSWALDGRYGSYFIKRLRGGINTGQIVISMPSSAGTIALQGTSGIDFKHDIKDADLTEAMERIEAMRMVNFIYNDDEENRVRFGIIAEEAELIAPQYIKHNQEPYEDILDEDGNKIGEKTRDRPSVDVNPIVMDLMGCVQYLNKQIEDLKAEIAALKK